MNLEHNLSPELAMWRAALNLLIKDAHDYLCRGADEDGHRKAAYDDLMRCGPMTCRLARFCLLDPVFVADLFRRLISEREIKRF